MKSFLLALSVLVATNASASVFEDVRTYKMYPQAFAVPNIQCDIYRELTINAPFGHTLLVINLVLPKVKARLINKLNPNSTCNPLLDLNPKEYELSLSGFNLAGELIFAGKNAGFVDSRNLEGGIGGLKTAAITFTEGAMTLFSLDTTNRPTDNR